MFRRRKVALVIESSTYYGRCLLRGITRYIQSHEPWSLYFEQRQLGAAPPAWLRRWRGDGIIFRSAGDEFAAWLKNSRIAAVDLDDRQPASGWPRVGSDDAAIGMLAASHLIDRGFRNFAFCGFEGERWSMLRKRGFEAEILARKPGLGKSGQSKSGPRKNSIGPVIECFESPWAGPDIPPWEREQARIVAWLKRLPKPVGIFASNDMRGQHVLDACLRAGIPVPEQAAVIGVDDDEVLCRLCDPPLSSVIPNAERVGYNAAEWLQQLMQNKPLQIEETGSKTRQSSAGSATAPNWATGTSGDREPPMNRDSIAVGSPIHAVVSESNIWCVPPLGVTTRASSDVLAIDDEQIAAAVSFIREHACAGLSVQDVLAHVPLSRTILERRFRKHVGHSPQAEIRRVQLRRVQQLLTETELKLEQVSRLAGFQHSEYLNVVFKRETGKTPGEYRRSSRIP